MSDTFGHRFRVDLGPDLDQWAVLDAARDMAVEALRKIDGDVEVFIHAVVGGASSIARGRVADAVDVLTSMGQEVDYALSTVVSHPKGKTLVRQAVITFGLHRQRKGPSGPQWYLNVECEADERMHLEWLKSQCEDFRRRIEQGKLPFTPAASNAPRPGDLPREGAAHVATIATPAPAPVPASEPEVSWLRRTWRDHTMTFVGTVLGTVVAAAILAVLKLSV